MRTLKRSGEASDSSKNSYQDIRNDIEKLEDVVERLKDTLDGRKSV